MAQDEGSGSRAGSRDGANGRAILEAFCWGQVEVCRSRRAEMDRDGGGRSEQLIGQGDFGGRGQCRRKGSA